MQLRLRAADLWVVSEGRVSNTCANDRPDEEYRLES